jgi:hypothetical protein
MIADMGHADNVVTLGHEAYRNGVAGENNGTETAAAVIAHTELADRMRSAGHGFNSEGVARLDLAVYDYVRSVGDMSIMNAYADMMYRSDGDYFDFNAIKDSLGWADIGTILSGDKKKIIGLFAQKIAIGIDKSGYDQVTEEYNKLKDAHTDDTTIPSRFSEALPDFSCLTITYLSSMFKTIRV